MLRKYIKFSDKETYELFRRNMKKVIFLIKLNKFLISLTNNNVAIIAVKINSNYIRFLIGSKYFKYKDLKGWGVDVSETNFREYKAYLNDISNYKYFWHAYYFININEFSSDLNDFYIFHLSESLFLKFKKFFQTYKKLL